MVPLLAWLRQHQPELMTNDEQRKEGIGSRPNPPTTSDIIIVADRAGQVGKTNRGLAGSTCQSRWKTLYDGITWELFINGEPINHGHRRTGAA